MVGASNRIGAVVDDQCDLHDSSGRPSEAPDRARLPPPRVGLAVRWRLGLLTGQQQARCARKVVIRTETEVLSTDSEHHRQVSGQDSAPGDVRVLYPGEQ